MVFSRCNCIRIVTLVILFCCYCPIISNYPQNTNFNDPEIITVAEIIHYSTDMQTKSNSEKTPTNAISAFPSAAPQNNPATDADAGAGASAHSTANSMSTATSVSTSGDRLIIFDEPNIDEGIAANENNESTMDPTEDDLIFLTKKTTGQRQRNPKDNRNDEDDEFYRKIDLLTSSPIEHSGSAAVDELSEIELRVDGTERTIEPMLDMSDFVALVPIAEVKIIAANYYRNDAEVQRAYAFLNSRDFIMLKEHIINVPEMSAFLKYLKKSGLDVVKFLNRITHFTTSTAMEQPTSYQLGAEHRGDLTSGNEIDRNEVADKSSSKHPSFDPLNSNMFMATSTTSSRTMKKDESVTTATFEQLNGLNGLVDSILNVLPQDQILATFFDKLETNEQFGKLINSFSAPEFSLILNNMQNSLPLRNLIFMLHNNGINITRIVSSLKAYFFYDTL